MGKKIRIVKDRPTDYTFIDGGLQADPASAGSKPEGKKNERRLDPRIGPELKKKFKPKLTGGHNKQGHSPVYE